ncbi:hypothetical protein UFOVP787_6 [uncultured Caudovirales phage]|uniref:Uncharacterized protein n=1 Tax=uncultured Caudovirales phage TaxID=2100421 RepID=A0A6J5NQ73_9CAUD|nr:hypothetical protein UFOVP787_6 [uncultured Caudovirales phage]
MQNLAVNITESTKEHIIGVHDNYWTVALNDNCVIVTFRQDQLKICKSYTHSRNISNEEMKDILK